MLCTSCGKQTPENGAFCLHCGTRMAGPAVAHGAPVEWEYKDFIYKFPPPGKGMWARIGSGAYSEAGAKLEFWQNYQREIYAELQKWEDDGWQPVGAVDSGCIELRISRSHRDKTAGYWIMVLIFTILSGGLFLIIALIAASTIAEPTRLVAQMRRPKQVGAAQLPVRAAALHLPPQQQIKEVSMCPRCAFTNRKGARFCSRCGQPLVG